MYKLQCTTVEVLVQIVVEVVVEVAVVVVVVIVTKQANTCKCIDLQYVYY